MRVLNVNMTLDPVHGGGTAERTYQMSKYLAKKQIPCTILTLDLNLNPEYLEQLTGVKVVALPCVLRRYYIPKFKPREIYDLVNDADIVHIMNHWTPLNALVYCYARYLRKPYVVCPAGTLVLFGRSRWLKKSYDVIVGRDIIRNASGCIAITASEIPLFVSYGIVPENICVIPNGVYLDDAWTNDEYGFRKRYGLANSPFILFLGRLNAIKGPDLLLQAFSRLRQQFPDYHLVFAGPDDGMLAELERLVVNTGLEKRVHFIGYVGGETKYQAYLAADLLVIPSRHEAMSIVALEAGIAGTPVLLTDQCGFDEVASVGGGEVVPATVDGLEKGLVHLLSSPSELKTMGESLRQHTLEHFSWDTLASRHIEFYSRILKETQESNVTHPQIP